MKRSLDPLPCTEHHQHKKQRINDDDNQFGVNELPCEILLLIWSFLPSSQRFVLLPQVCRHWWILSADPSLHCDFDPHQCHLERCGTQINNIEAEHSSMQGLTWKGKHASYQEGKCPFNLSGKVSKCWEAIFSDSRLCGLKRFNLFDWPVPTFKHKDIAKFEAVLPLLPSRLPNLEELAFTQYFTPTIMASIIPQFTR